MVNKLELTIGKNKPVEMEPCILLEHPDLSCRAEADLIETGIYDNMLIHGDNLLALKAIEAKFSGQVKCIYIDPLSQISSNALRKTYRMKQLNVYHNIRENIS